MAFVKFIFIFQPYSISIKRTAIFQVVVFARSDFPEPDVTDLVRKDFTESDANKSVRLAHQVK